MSKRNEFTETALCVVISGTGGFLLSFTGLPVGWMIGTLLTATLLFIFKPKILKVSFNQKGIPKYWMAIGQCILGIELGQKVNDSVYYIFLENWLTITIMLLLSIIFSLVSGLIVWKFSDLDMLTSFFSTAPGGLSTIPGIAEELGANTGVVSIAQTIRIFLVVLFIPLCLSFWVIHPIEATGHTDLASNTFQGEHLLTTALFLGIACLGYFLGVLLKFPAPWLLGSMVAIAIVKSSSSVVIGYQLVAWWPPELIILSQVVIGASIGSRFQKEMFKGLKKTLAISFLSTIFLIVSMFFCSVITARITELSFTTSVLAFAPGGIAEMTTTAVVLGADSTLVVAVQVLRVISVCVILPPFFKLLNYWNIKKRRHSQASA
ncbi:AbrB family transcriptional regulator [Sporosarcina sp. P7]|uniref:AbrB family transcriptional regulator n=1 Tax=Sporosarcina sp. P7 TaxID=2048244 RepID=UPI000C16DB7C|nr:AbrB family transcriptional regulator [Sporosarcina sp. P7]PID24199.1 hypothetical protein CSV60_10960 [Sporosarcina sp. P7]